MKYRIENTQSGHVFGVYEADNPDHALDVMARDAGYDDYPDCCTRVIKADLLVTEDETEITNLGQTGDVIVSRPTPDEESEGGACPDCGTPAVFRTCSKCDTAQWVIDCGHYAQPRPISAGTDGELCCDSCY